MFEQDKGFLTSGGEETAGLAPPAFVCRSHSTDGCDTCLPRQDLPFSGLGVFYGRKRKALPLRNVLWSIIKALTTFCRFAGFFSIMAIAIYVELWQIQKEFTTFWIFIGFHLFARSFMFTEIWVCHKAFVTFLALLWFLSIMDFF